MQAWIFSFFLLASVSISAETLQFETNLDAAHALPSTASIRVAPGLFTLEDSSRFRGYVMDRGFGIGVTSVKIFESAESTTIGLPRFEFSPGILEEPFPPSIPGGRQFDIDLMLSGHWWVNLSTAEFPGGEIRGQITIVPEPSAFALLGPGIAAFALANRRRIPA